MALYDDPRRAVPAYLPGALDDPERPVGCATSLEVAGSFGYPLAVPDGVEEVAGFLVEDVSDTLRERCQWVATMLGHAVACPAVLPATWEAFDCPTRDGPPCVAADLPDEVIAEGAPRGSAFLYELSASTFVPGRICGPCDVEVALASAPADRPGPHTLCDPLNPRGGPLTRDAPRDGQRCNVAAGWLTSRGLAPHADHVMVRWEQDAAVHAVSVGGEVGEEAAAALAEALAGRATIVEP